MTGETNRTIRSAIVSLLIAILLFTLGCTIQQKEAAQKETIANDQQATILGSNITDEISSVDKELDELEKISENGAY